MRINGILAKARKYADGDGVIIDLYQAWSLYSQIKQSLSGDDLEMYETLCGIFDEEAAPPIPEEAFTSLPTYMYLSQPESLDSTSKSTKSKKKAHTAAETKALFDALLAGADSRTINKVYSALERIADPEKERKDDNVRFGNNLGMLLHQCGKKASDLRHQMELLNYRSFTPAAISQIISGKNGISPESLNSLLSFINDRWAGQNFQFRSPSKTALTKEDMYLGPQEFLEIFKSPIIDKEVRVFLKKLGCDSPAS